MNIESMKKVLDNLIGLKQTMHGEANASVSQQLDEAISIVQLCIDSGSNDSDAANRVMSAIGKVLDKLPSIAALLKLFYD